jgi:hypothetical protein
MCGLIHDVVLLLYFFRETLKTCENLRETFARDLCENLCENLRESLRELVRIFARTCARTLRELARSCARELRELAREPTLPVSTDTPATVRLLLIPTCCALECHEHRGEGGDCRLTKHNKPKIQNRTPHRFCVFVGYYLCRADLLRI